MRHKILSLILKVYSLFISKRLNYDIPLVLINEKNKERVKIHNNSLKELREKKKIVIHFTTHKIAFLHYSKYANYIFSYGLSNYINPLNLKFLYIGEVGQSQSRAGSLTVYNAPNFVFHNISDYVVSSVFAYERGLLQNLWKRNNFNWNQKAYLNSVGKNLKDIKVGIFGLGNIGSSCAESFKNFGCEVHGFDLLTEKSNLVDNFYTDKNFHEMLDIIDYLIITINNQGNQSFFNEKLLSKVNHNCCIVNVSRGDVIDVKALIKKINSKSIRGAILDVFNNEPLSKNSPLWNTDGIIISPHIAGNIDLVFDKIADDFVQRIKQNLEYV